MIKLVVVLVYDVWGIINMQRADRNFLRLQCRGAA